MVKFLSEIARENKCSAFQEGKCFNKFKVKPYCIGQLYPELTAKKYWPECLTED